MYQSIFSSGFDSSNFAKFERMTIFLIIRGSGKQWWTIQLTGRGGLFPAKVNMYRARGDIDSAHAWGLKMRFPTRPSRSLAAQPSLICKAANLAWVSHLNASEPTASIRMRMNRICCAIPILSSPTFSLVTYIYYGNQRQYLNLRGGSLRAQSEKCWSKAPTALQPFLWSVRLHIQKCSQRRM